jgi:hypothetical protein
MRDVKIAMALNSGRPLTSDEETVLRMGILAGSNAMLQELVRLDLFERHDGTEVTA